MLSKSTSMSHLILSIIILINYVIHKSIWKNLNIVKNLFFI